MQTILEQNIETLIAEPVTSQGFTLVRVKFMESGESPTLQIMIEKKDGAMPNLDECATISRSISAILDVEDPIPGEYNLEVSSPGIDRPLVKLEDFERFSGKDIKIVLQTPVDGRKRFSGRLEGVTDNMIEIVVEDAANDERVTLPFENISAAKLLLTDALLKEAAS